VRFQVEFIPFMLDSVFFSQAGVGVGWLQYLLRQNNEHNQNDLSEDGKLILKHLLKEHALLDGNNNDQDNHDDDSDVDIDDRNSDIDSSRLKEPSMQEHESWNFITNYYTETNRNENTRSLLFPTILQTIFDLYDKYETENKEKDMITNINEIIQSCLACIEQSHKNGTMILRPSDIPASMDSNQIVIAALLYLSSSVDGISYVKQLPQMPLLQRIYDNNNDEDGIPQGFQICQQNITQNMLDNHEFRFKLATLEASFWKTSSRIDYIPRLHTIPRMETNSSEEKLMQDGTTTKAQPKKRKSSINTSSTAGNKKKQKYIDDSKSI